MKSSCAGMLLALVAATGCGGTLAQTRDENDRLRAQVAELRAAKRRADVQPTRAAVPPGPRDVPMLPVEVVSPTVAAAGADTDVAAPSAAEAHGVEDPDGDDFYGEVEAPAPTPRPRAAAEAPMPADAPTRYRAAMDALQAGDHVAAARAFAAFVHDYPRHDYADNAQYWLAESFYDRRDLTRALVEFKRVVDEFPRGNKVPDAMLKVGYCYLALGQRAAGRDMLRAVTTRYPKTDPARLALERLETLSP